MQINVSRRAKTRLILLLSVGAAAGFLNGLLGAGGGILLVYALTALNPDRSPDAVRDNFAATIAAVLPITLLSAILYAADGRMDFSAVTPLVLPALVGGTAGAFLLGRINTNLLKKLFALLVIWSGLYMLFR
ncbi:MAG: sulfite exporter TauE/SafE family protein [Clostridia bacterium]|nr:sulfite exporter TauE/SafE family protein [Clostridia bacterium]